MHEFTSTSNNFTALFRFENTTSKQCLKDCNLHTTEPGNNDCLSQCGNTGSFIFRSVHLLDVNDSVAGYQNLPAVPEAICDDVCEAKTDTQETGVYYFVYPYTLGTGHGLTVNETICLRQCPPARADLTKAAITFTNDTGVNTKLATFRYMKASDNKCYDTCALWRDVTVNSFANTRSCVDCCGSTEYIKTTTDDTSNTVRCVAGPTTSEYWYEHPTVGGGCTSPREIISITSCGGTYTSVNPGTSKAAFTGNFTVKDRTSTPPNQCVNQCPGYDLPDSGNVSSHQYVCREKCDKTTTYKFRTTISSIPVCHTECTSKHFYETTDGEYVCLPDSHCNTSPITNDRLNNSYTDFKFRHKFSTTDHFQCKADCTYAFVQHGTSPVHKTCVSKCSDSSINSFDILKIKVDDSATESGKKECVTACSNPATEYLFDNSQADRQCTSTCPPPGTDANLKTTAGGTTSEISALQAFVSHDGNRFCIIKTDPTCPLYIKESATIR